MNYLDIDSWASKVGRFHEFWRLRGFASAKSAIGGPSTQYTQYPEIVTVGFLGAWASGEEWGPIISAAVHHCVRDHVVIYEESTTLERFFVKIHDHHDSSE